MKNNPMLQDQDLEEIAQRKTGKRLARSLSIVAGVALLIGGGVWLARSGSSASPAVTSVPSAAEPVAPPIAKTAPATSPVEVPAKPAPEIAAAIESPHEEVIEPKAFTPADHLRLARQLERQASKNRKIAAAEYRKEAAHYRRVASLDRRKAMRNARLARTFQRLALRSVRRGA